MSTQSDLARMAKEYGIELFEKRQKRYRTEKERAFLKAQAEKKKADRAKRKKSRQNRKKGRK